METDKESADKGDKITLTVKPLDGYKLDALMVDGKDVSTLVEAGKYSFTMSDHDVTVEATFTTETKQKDAITLKTGKDINAILKGFGTLNVTQFKKSDATNSGASQYLDLSGEIPVWLDGTTVYYYIPDGRTVYMNADSSKMFYACSALTSLDLGSFDTGSVTYMVGMFDGCSGLTNLNLSSFNTGNVTDMSYMFRGCSKLTSLDLGSFNTGNVTNMSSMFRGCSALMTIYATNNFVTTNVTSDFACFADCTKLEGGAGTTYSSSHTNSEYARIDGVSSGSEGYFTAKP